MQNTTETIELSQSHKDTKQRKDDAKSSLSIVREYTRYAKDEGVILHNSNVPGTTWTKLGMNYRQGRGIKMAMAGEDILFLFCVW